MTIINESLLFPWGLINSFVIGFLFFGLSNSILKRKYSNLIIFSLFTASQVLSFLFKFHVITSLTPLIRFAFVCAIIVFCYKGNTVTKIIKSFIIYIEYWFCVMLSSFEYYIFPKEIRLLETQITGAVYKSYLFDTVLTYCFTMIIGILLMGISKFISNKKDVNYNKKYTFLLIYPIISTVVMILMVYYYGLFYLYFEKVIPSAFSTAISVTFLVIFAVNITVFLTVEKMQAIDAQNKKYEKRLLQNQLDYQEAILVRKNKSELRKIRHDLSNILLAIKSSICIGQNDEAISLINKTTENLSTVDGIVLCSNSTLNSFLSLKKQQAENAGAILNISILENAPIKADNYDMCRLVGNIIDNGIEAVSKISNKEILFQIESNDSLITVKSKNSYTNLNKKEKRTKRGHGKKIINDIANKYNGKYTSNIYYNEYIDTIEIKNTLPTPPNTLSIIYWRYMYIHIKSTVLD